MSFKSAAPLLILLSLPVMAQELSLAQKAEDAMASRLWEVAAQHYSTLLQEPDAGSADMANLRVRLSEAWIRGGKPAEALDLLASPDLESHPESRFWQGQALAAMGRFNEAAEALKPLIGDPSAPHRNEAGFTVASLELALEQPDAALMTLSSLSENAPPDSINQARLRQSFILFDLGRIAEAREIMPHPTGLSPREQSLARFLEANLLLAEGKFAEAATVFAELVANPENLSVRHYHSSLIGQADAMQALGNSVESADLLLNFIQQHPDSPLLEKIFDRLLAALPASPSVSNPILERLEDWITPAEIPATGLVPTHECLAVSAWPVDSPVTDLLSFALFTRAIGLHRLDSDQARAEARHLLARLHAEQPTHFLSTRALLTRARWDLNEGHIEQAHHILEILRASATSPLLKGRAAFLEALSNGVNDPEEAARLFNEAAEHLSGRRADIARYNAALVQLSQPIPGSTHAILPSSGIHDRKLAANLQLEQALALDNPNEKRAAIEDYLIDYPEHPRAGEARLMVANAALASTPPDISFALAQVETIEANEEMRMSLPESELALLRLRISDLTGDIEKTIASARTIIADFPASTEAEEASFIIGRNLFATGNYNDARLVLEKLAASVTSADQRQAAWLLAARSAALVPTSQSQQEALALFDKATAIDGALSAITKLEKARLMIDMGKLIDASAFLTPWFESLPDDAPLHQPVGLLLGESIYAQGNINPESLSQALAVYEELIRHTEAFSSAYDRLQYLRGRTLEQLPDPDNPAIKRDKQAFMAYYSVLERTTPPEQWHYFELCGFQALSLLEKARRWPAAITCAKKIASFKGPRAEEAAGRANQIQLKHMIWED